MIKSKKNLLVLLLLFVSLVCLFTATATMGTVKPVKANANFVMENGAAVRVVKGESGIKFIAKVPEPTQGDTKEYRMLIVPEKLLTNKNIEDDFVNELKANYPDQAQNWDTNFWDKTVYPYYDEELSSYVVSGALGVDESRHNEKFCGIAYYMDGNEFVYATHKDSKTIFDNARSVSLVSSLALNDADNDFSADEKSILKNYVSSAISASELSFGTEFISAKINSVLDAKINNVSDLDVQYEVGDENVAKVEDGAITLIGHGSTTVTAKIGDQFSTSITVDCPTMNQLLADAVAKSKQINQYYVMGSVATEADANAPKGFENGLKYVITPTEVVGSGNYYGFPVSLNKNNSKSSAYKDFFSVTDWSNAYVTFKVYNAGTVPVTIGLTKGMTNDTHWALSTENVSVAVGEEKNVCFSIKDAMGLTCSPFETEDFKVGRGLNIMTYNLISGLTTDTLSDGAQTLYISDFDIITLTNDELVRSELLYKFVEAGNNGNSLPYQYHFGLLTESMSKDVKKETDASIKYVMTAMPNSSASRYAAAIKLLKDDLTSIANIQECESFDNAYIGFWIKNDFNVDLDVRLYCQSDVAIDSAPLSTTKVKNTDGWVYVEISVASILSNLNNGCGFSISYYYGTNKEGLGDGATFYIDGFEIYNKETVTLSNLNSAIVSYAEGDSNVTAEVVTDTQYLREGSQSVIKYTLTNDGVDRGYYAGTRTGNFILDDTGILFDLYKEEITDWGTAYIGFYIKNVSSHDLYVAPRFQTATGEGSSKQWQGTVLKYEWNQAHKSVAKNSTSWQYVEMSLNDIASAADNMYVQTQANKGQFYTESLTGFKLCLAVSGYGMTNVGDSATFYIDGISIYNK